MNLQQELDRAIGHGPDLPPPSDRLLAGRAALRRRRLAVGGGALLAAAALVVPAAALTGGTERGTEVPPVTTPSTDPPSPGREPSFPEPEQTLAYVDFDTGRLVIQPRVEVVRRVDDLYPGTKIRSVALDVRRGERREWLAWEWTERGGSVSISGPSEGTFDSFDDFVADAVSTGPVRSGPPVGPEGQP